MHNPYSPPQTKVEDVEAAKVSDIKAVTKKKPMHLAAYLGLCFLAWFTGAVIASFGISVAMGNLYAEATFSAIIGFWLGKIALNNKSRDWSGIVALPIINLITALLGLVFSTQNPDIEVYSPLIILIAAFALSCVWWLFALPISVATTLLVRRALQKKHTSAN